MEDLGTFDSRRIRLSLSKTVLNTGDQNEELECFGYKRNIYKSVLAHFLSLICLGIPYLIGYWKPEWEINWYRSLCPLVQADTVLLKEKNSEGETGTSGGSGAAVVPITSQNVSADFIAQYVHHSDDEDLASDSSNSDSSGQFSDNDDRMPLWSPIRHTLRYFEYHHVRYVWDFRKKTYTRLFGLDKNTPLNLFNSVLTQGLTKDMQSIRQVLYGLNSINVEVKPYLKLLFEEVLNPFYIFQIGSILLWSLDNYYYYAGCICFISVVSVIITLLETRRQSQSLHDMVVSSNTLTAKVYRGQDIFEDIPSINLVPGDVIAIPAQGCTMPCDAVLVAGTCIVNESMLTGESVPVTKSSLPLADMNDEDEDHYDPERHKRHTLFSGTSVIQTRYYGKSDVLAVVVRTGFETAKGALIRSILYPKPMGFKFYRDSIRFICVLFCVAAIGMVYCVYVYIKRGSAFRMIALRCLDIITIVVPPALPAAMTVGTYYAQNRLKKTKIFCISPQRINVCGKLKLVCFDKTGTLTEDGLDFYGVKATNSCTNLENENSSKSNEFYDQINENLDNFPPKSPLLTCLATCHSLTLINNDLTGDPLDVKMFESTKWTLEEEGNDTSRFDMLMPTVVRPPMKNRGFKQSPEKQDLEKLSEFTDPSQYPYEVGIIRQFTFSSAVARMSVITRSLGDDHFHVFTKGAPEKIEELCLPHTLPQDFHQQLRILTLKGYRVIGLAHKQLPLDINWLKAQKLKRNQVEKDLIFLGFLIMQNTLKTQTTSVIHQLIQANIRCVMVTGDNLLTAVSVARDCHMIQAYQKVLIVEAIFDEDNENQPALVRFVPTENENEIIFNDDINVVIEENVQDYHFAINGKSWAVLRWHFPHLVPKIIQRGTVFARMSPDQKAQLIEEYQNIDYIVSMCGDGANDCGALKAAHVGISLSEAEASVAAPFTSRIPDITCVPIVIREGRCSLVTSFGVFKYMALYSMVQFISVLLLYTLLTNLGDQQFLYIDLVITTTVAVLMGWTKSYEKLVPQRPPGSLMSGPNLVSIFAQILVTLLIQIGAYVYLSHQSWYQPLDPPNPEKEIVLCWETTTVFCVSSFQYLILAAVFSKGRPYRQPFYSNLPFLISLIVLIGFTALLTLYPGSGLAKFFQLMFNVDHLHLDYRFILLVFGFANLVICIFIEKAIVERRWLKNLLHFVIGKKQPKNKFKIIQREMNQNGWPNVDPMEF